MMESVRVRQGESRFTRFRTNRYFVQNNGWFFNTREGNCQGPFQTREQAEQRVFQYVEKQRIRYQQQFIPENSLVMGKGVTAASRLIGQGS